MIRVLWFLDLWALFHSLLGRLPGVEWVGLCFLQHTPYPPTPFHPRQGGKGGLILLLVSGTGETGSG